MSGPIHHMIGGAPAPVAPYSHAVEVDGWLLVTGQLATDPADDDTPLPDGIEAQTEKTLDNLTAVLKGLGLGFEHVVQARVFLTRFERDYAAMNALYARRFETGKLPARTCIGVTALARGALVEIDLVVKRPD